ncbi:hypothetical protein, partial [Lentimicrobium sp.]|uniref:hypothetical protein n=1 Tax=Lentimicrobium sp. TaxID=2034841 RepID=UPI002C3F530C
MLKALMHQKYNEATFNPVNPQSEISRYPAIAVSRDKRNQKSKIRNPKFPMPDYSIIVPVYNSKDSLG